jgi:hypothetical protein
MQQEFLGKPMLYWIIQKDGLGGLWVENPRRIVKKREGDVGVNANYLSHASNSVISSSLAIRFTDDVVNPRNRATDAPAHPNFRTIMLVLACP